MNDIFRLSDSVLPVQGALSSRNSSRDILKFQPFLQKKKIWSSNLNLAPNVLPEAAVVATGAPIGLRSACMATVEGIFFWVHALSCDN